MKNPIAKNLIGIYLKPIAVGLILLAALISLLLWEREDMQQQASRSVYNTAENLAKTLQGVIQFQYKCGRAHALDQILENIMSFSKIKSILLRHKNKVIMQVGEKTQFPNVTEPEGFELIGDKFYYWTNLDSGMIFVLPAIIETDIHSHNVIQSFAISAKSASPDLFFGIIIEDKEYFSLIREGNIKLIIAFLCGFTAILILVSAWINLIRNNQLKLELSEIKKKNEYLSELSLVASGLAHETKNPLGIIRGLAQRINSGQYKCDPLIRKFADKIIEESDITSERLSDFMNYADIREFAQEPLRIKALVEEITELMRYDFDKSGVSLEMNIQDATIKANREALLKIIVNLLQNSIQACKQEDKIIITFCSKGKSADIVICDTGTGISPDIINNIFQPYVSRTKNGHGIGLAIVKKLLDASGWNIKVESELGQGTKMIISGISVI